MPQLSSVAVFCGAQPGRDPRALAAATMLGAGLAESGMQLVYGGGQTGMMGAVADAVLDGGGAVMGVIPQFLTQMEVAHPGVAEMIVTDSMHSRKQLMFASAEAFVILPGGLGTLDELAEIITWRQLGLHDKPIIFCDVCGWAEPVVRLVDAFIAGGFAQPSVRDLYEVMPDVESVLTRLRQMRPAPDDSDASRL